MYKFVAHIVILIGIMSMGLYANADDRKDSKAKAKNNPSHMQNTSLPGYTYKSITLLIPNAENCQKACSADKNCKAWTLQTNITPTLRNPSTRALCRLKNQVPKSRRDTCCISGVKNVVYKPNIAGSITQPKSKPILVVPQGKKISPFRVKVPVLVKKKPSIVVVTPRKKVGTTTPGVIKKKSPTIIVKPFTVKRPKVTVKPATPNPPTTKAPANLSSIGTAVNIPGMQSGNALINPAVVSMFDNIAARRGKALQDALESQKRNEAARVELRRRQSANQPTGRATSLLDCDDSDPGIHPNQNEVCNFKDDNCNGTIDEGVTITVYRDADGDGFGDPEQRVEACATGGGLAGMSLNANDCDDSSARLNPAAGTCE